MITVRKRSCGKVMILHLSVHREEGFSDQGESLSGSSPLLCCKERQCTSYWNAFLFIMLLMLVMIKCHNIMNGIMNDILNDNKLSQYL